MKPSVPVAPEAQDNVEQNITEQRIDLLTLKVTHNEANINVISFLRFSPHLMSGNLQPPPQPQTLGGLFLRIQALREDDLY